MFKISRLRWKYTIAISDTVYKKQTSTVLKVKVLNSSGPKFEQCPRSVTVLYCFVFICFFLPFFQVTMDHNLQSDWSVYFTLSFPHLNLFCLCSNLPHRAMRSHDCLYSRRHHLEHAGLWLFTHSACDITLALFPPKRCSVSSLSLSYQIGCGSVTPRPTCSRKPIPPKRRKDKLNLMPCNKLSRLLCTVRHCVSGGSGAGVHFLICMEIMSRRGAGSKPLSERSEFDIKSKIWDASKTFAFATDELTAS